VVLDPLVDAVVGDDVEFDWSPPAVHAVNPTVPPTVTAAIAAGTRARWRRVPLTTMARSAERRVVECFMPPAWARTLGRTCTPPGRA
jgi:hypothetical protein